MPGLPGAIAVGPVNESYTRAPERLDPKSGMVSGPWAMGGGVANDWQATKNPFSTVAVTVGSPGSWTTTLATSGATRPSAVVTQMFVGALLG